MAGMAEQRKEWLNSRMAEMATYVLFMVHTVDYTDTDDNDNEDTFNQLLLANRFGILDTSS